MSFIAEYNPVAQCWLTFTRALPESKDAFFQIWGFNQVDQWYSDWPILVYYLDGDVFIKNGPNAFKMEAAYFRRAMEREGATICGRLGTRDTISAADWIAAQEHLPQLRGMDYAVVHDWKQEGF